MEREIIRFENLDLPIRIHRLSMREDSNYRGMHSHMAVEIVVVKSGILNCRINDDQIMVRPQQIIFINSNTGHRLYSENAEVVYYQIDISLLQEKISDDRFQSFYSFMLHTQVKPYLLLEDDRELTDLLNKINAKYYEDSRESYWYEKAYLYELVAFMHSRSFIVSVKIPREQFEKIERIVFFIDTHFKLPVTLDEICSFVKYNKYTICHMFKEATGSTVFDYINYLRVHYAVEKLRENRESILQIAAECGFSSATYFNRVFRSYFGCAPSVYRKFLIKNGKE